MHIGNALGKFIDRANNKDQYDCARICLEVDLEEGLPEAIKIKVGSWTHVQKLDYEQLPFKCQKCQFYGHFARNCPTANEEAQGKEVGWNQVKRSKMSSKIQKPGGTSGKCLQQDPVQQIQQTQPKFTPENRFDPLSSQPEDSHAVANQKPVSQDKGSLPHIFKDTGVAEISKGTPDVVEEEDQELEDSEEEGEIGESQSFIRRSTRGRKTDREKREHETHKDKLQDSQPTLEKLLAKNPKMARNQHQGSKGAQPSKEKRICWDSLRRQADLGNLENVIIAGDLNITLHSSEKRGGCIVRDPSREWAEDLLQDWDLIDIKPVSGKFTWSNKRLGPGHIAARLDRFFVHSFFLLLGLDASMHILPCSTSNHKPIMLNLRAHTDLGPIPFKFSSLWIKEPSFMQIVKESWSLPISGSPFYIWEEKIRRLKSNLKRWAKSLANPAAERKSIQSQLEAHHLLTKEAYISREILDKEAHLQQHYHKTCLAEEETWRIKSRYLWLKVGDRNTSFFHKQAESRKCFNSITEIKEGDIIDKDFANIKHATHHHFKCLYSVEANTHQNFYLLDGVPTLISAEENHYLENKVTVEEVKSALDAMDPDKSPGPDGFSASFLQTCWHIVGKDLYKMVQKSQACQKLGGGTNSSFLALIPKEKGANSFNRFHPISLCNIGYKLITKIIANRLKQILPRIIPENQGGFIHERYLVDNFILVQEAILSSQQRKEQGMAIKLDLANAFD
eukprot:PITA_17272